MLELTWGEGDAPLYLTDDAGPVRLALTQRRFTPDSGPVHTIALVEVLAVGYGRSPNSMRASGTDIGDRLRYVGHETASVGGVRTLLARQVDERSGLSAVTPVTHTVGQRAYRFATALTNGGDKQLQIQQVTSAAVTGLTGFLGERCELDLWRASNEWCGEAARSRPASEEQLAWLTSTPARMGTSRAAPSRR